MLNLSNAENLSISCFDRALDDVLQLVANEDEFQLQVLEAPQDTAKLMRKRVQTLREASDALKQNVIAGLSPAALRTEQRHRAMQQQLREAFRSQAASKNASVNLDVKANTVFPPSPSTPQRPQQQQGQPQQVPSSSSPLSNVSFGFSLTSPPSSPRNMSPRQQQQHSPPSKKVVKPKQEQEQQHHKAQTNSSSTPSASFFLPSISNNSNNNGSPQRSNHRHHDYDDDASSNSSDSSESSRAPPVAGSYSSPSSSSPRSPRRSKNKKQHDQRKNNSSTTSAAKMANTQHHQHQQPLFQQLSLPESMQVYLSCGTYLLLELIARATLARDVILYRHDPAAAASTSSSPHASIHVVNVFSTRPRLENWQDLTADTVVGRVITSGLAVNIAPEYPSATNVSKLCVPIHSSGGKRTLVVGALFLQERASGGNFSESEERLVAALTELVSHVVTPPCYLKPAAAGVDTPAPVATSLLPAIMSYLPNQRGRIVRNVLAPGSSSTAGGESSGSSSSSHTVGFGDAFCYDPFVHQLRFGQCSTIAFIESIHQHYRPFFEKARRDKIQADKQQQQQHKHDDSVDGKHHHHHPSSLSHLQVDNYVNTSVSASLFDTQQLHESSSSTNNVSDSTKTATQRVVSESQAHKFLLRLLEHLHAEHKKEQLSKLDFDDSEFLNSAREHHHHHHHRQPADPARDSTSTSVFGYVLRRASKQHDEQLAALPYSQLGRKVSTTSSVGARSDGGGSDHSSSGSGSKDLLSEAVKQQQQKERRKRELARFAEELKQSGMLAPDQLADLVDQMQAPLLIVRTVQQDWKFAAATNPSVAGTTRHGLVSAETSGGLLSVSGGGGGIPWIPSSSNAVSNTMHNRSAAAAMTATGYSECLGVGGNSNNSNISTEQCATLSTIPVVDVADHVRKLERSWRRSIEEARSTTVLSTTVLSNQGALEQKCSVLERQKAAAEKERDDAVRRYENIRNEVGLLVSKEVTGDRLRSMSTTSHHNSNSPSSRRQSQQQQQQQQQQVAAGAVPSPAKRKQPQAKFVD